MHTSDGAFVPASMRDANPAVGSRSIKGLIIKLQYDFLTEYNYVVEKFTNKNPTIEWQGREMEKDSVAFTLLWERFLSWNERGLESLMNGLKHAKKMDDLVAAALVRG